MTDYKQSDELMAAHWERVRQRLELEAALEDTLGVSVPLHEVSFGTMARSVQAAHELAHQTLAVALRDLAEQARTIAVDYRDHADGTYEPLRTSA